MPIEPTRYKSVCRNGHFVSLKLSNKSVEDDLSGRWVRCSECDKITYCPREKDENQKTTNQCPWLVDAEDPRVTML